MEGGAAPTDSNPCRHLERVAQDPPAVTWPGFEPMTCDGQIVQRNCPFHRLAQRSPALVCGINHSFVDGLLTGLEAWRLRAELAPAPERCCVVIHAS
jgi:predicted ArsR family transcriptional regulator